MTFIKSIFNNLKQHWMLILVSIWFGLYSWATVKKIESATEKIAKEMSLSKSFEKYENGDAVYMPGSACVIRATTVIDKQVFMDLAMACARKHEKYLESQEGLDDTKKQ